MSIMTNRLKILIKGLGLLIVSVGNPNFQSIYYVYKRMFFRYLKDLFGGGK